MQGIDHNLIGALKEAFYDVTMKQAGNLDIRTPISDLGLDSVAMMEFIGLLEENLSIRIQVEEVAALNTVADLLILIQSRVSPETLPREFRREKRSRISERKTTRLAPECWDMASFPEVLKLEQRLADIIHAGLHNPYFQIHDGIAKNRTSIGGVEMLNFSSYNYLGFSGHPEVMATAKDAIDRYGTSVSASRLVSGERPIHRQLEEGLARHIGVEAAIAFVSGVSAFPGIPVTINRLHNSGRGSNSIATGGVSRLIYNPRAAHG